MISWYCIIDNFSFCIQYITPIRSRTFRKKLVFLAVLKNSPFSDFGFNTFFSSNKDVWKYSYNFSKNAWVDFKVVEHCFVLTSFLSFFFLPFCVFFPKTGFLRRFLVASLSLSAKTVPIDVSWLQPLFLKFIKNR